MFTYCWFHEFINQAHELNFKTRWLAFWSGVPAIIRTDYYDSTSLAGSCVPGVDISPLAALPGLPSLNHRPQTRTTPPHTLAQHFLIHSKTCQAAAFCPLFPPSFIAAARPTKCNALSELVKSTLFIEVWGCRTQWVTQCTFTYCLSVFTAQLCVFTQKNKGKLYNIHCWRV